VNEVLAKLSKRVDALYAHTGRPSIPPEYLLRATLLQAFFTVRSEWQLMEQIDYNLLLINDRVWDATVFAKNRDRPLEAEVAREFLATLLSLPQVKRLLSSNHFSGKRDADRGVGVDEELPPDGWFGLTAQCRA
jgi:hypothetical protein